MKKIQTVILCGGSIDFLNLPINTNQSHAMIPVNGKPVIGWILDDLMSKGIYEVVITRRATDFQLCDFLNNAYSKRLKIKQIGLLYNENILDSLRAGLDHVPSDGLVRVILGDTLIRDSFQLQGDHVYVHEVSDSHRWCLATWGPDKKITRYLDKQDEVQGPIHALCGYYHFQNAGYLKNCVYETLSEKKTQISDVLKAYGKKYPLYAVQAQEWFDFGNIDNLISSRQRLLQGRYFNSLKIDGVLNTITKNSEFDEKLKDELNWYLLLPNELQVLVPRIINQTQSEDKIQIVQEYYGYSTISELFLYTDIHIQTWTSILRKLFKIHHKLKNFKGELTRQEVTSIYKNKTHSRLKDLKASSSYWENMLEKPNIILNQNTLANLPLLKDQMDEWIEKIVDTAEITIIHGDYCFSNILFDINTQITRLIDPRGSFGRKGIYGDARYDIAKLRHSICGLYDYIVSDLFTINELNEGEFESAILASETSKKISAVFDKLVVENGYNLDEIKFIEGLLFLSMIPLHKDKPERQKMMYLRGLELMNEVLKNNYENCDRPGRNHLSN